jgi:hypothetical protein
VRTGSTRCALVKSEMPQVIAARARYGQSQDRQAAR